MAKIVNKEEKRREIALASLDVFAEYGLHKITIDKIAAAAGIGKGTVYQYFGNKEEIVLEIWQSLLEEHDVWLEKQFEIAKNESEKIIPCIFLGHFKKNQLKKYFSLYRDFVSASVQASPIFQEFSRQHFYKRLLCVQKHLEAGIRSGEFYSIDTEYFSEILLHTHNGIVYSAMERGLGVEYINETLPQLLETLLQTIKKEKR